MSPLSSPATGPLRADHDQLARVLVGFDRVLDDSVRHRAVVDDLAFEFGRFFEEFGDGFHHHREEELLFPAVRRVELDYVDEDVLALLAEHDVGRRGLEGMRANLAGAVRGGSGSLETYLRYARNLGDGWRRHMDHEERVTFPLADRLLVSAPLEQLDAAYAESEERWSVQLGWARDFVLCVCERFEVRDADLRPIGTRSAHRPGSPGDG